MLGFVSQETGGPAITSYSDLCISSYLYDDIVILPTKIALRKDKNYINYAYSDQSLTRKESDNDIIIDLDHGKKFTVSNQNDGSTHYEFNLLQPGNRYYVKINLHGDGKDLMYDFTAVVR